MVNCNASVNIAGHKAKQELKRLRTHHTFAARCLWASRYCRRLVHELAIRRVDLQARTCIYSEAWLAATCAFLSAINSLKTETGMCVAVSY